MVFYETLLMVHGKFPASETRLLLREASRLIVERDGSLFRILDLGWRHTAQPIRKKGVGHVFYGRWYSLTWGGPPQVPQELKDTFLHNTGVLRHITLKAQTPKQMYNHRSTFYPVLVPGMKGVAPPMVHHTSMPDVSRS
eukprot:TRINITY_DN49052_c0_g1_i1.p2 TRINITY_DN49052_c0_g1~~TRINITY_DN49052_c0_g1_i1.p2  ORF type:complete len:139 (-),score=16.25 TRINITY_DN49052_c0_g1_i1:154-570(-)